MTRASITLIKTMTCEGVFQIPYVEPYYLKTVLFISTNKAPLQSTCYKPLSGPTG